MPSKRRIFFIPSTTLYEADGIFVNQEGRAQTVRQAYSGGVPIVQSGGGDHPPRIYGTGIPGADPMPAWLTLARIGRRPKKAGQIKRFRQTFYQWLADIVPELADVDLSADIPDEGLRLNSGVKTDLRFTTDFSGRARGAPGEHWKSKINFD